MQMLRSLFMAPFLPKESDKYLGAHSFHRSLSHRLLQSVILRAAYGAWHSQCPRKCPYDQSEFTT